MGEGVHGEWVQLVDGNEVPPVIGQGAHRLVAFEYGFDEWGSEEGEHGQVGFGVSAVRCRVDEKRLDPAIIAAAVVSACVVQGGFGEHVFADRAPVEQVAGPQVPVDAAGHTGCHVGTLPGRCRDEFAGAFDGSFWVVDVSGIHSLAVERQHPLRGVEPRPVGIWFAGLGLGTDEVGSGPA